MIFVYNDHYLTLNATLAGLNTGLVWGIGSPPLLNNVCSFLIETI